MTWIRSEQKGVERRILYLRSHDLPVDPDTAIDDLRVYQDAILAPGSEVVMPSLDTLARRWGWFSRNGKPSEKRVRLLLCDEEKWSDPRRLAEWREYRGHAEGTPRAQQGHTKGTPPPAPTPNTDETGHAEGTPRAQQGHAEGNTRGDLDLDLGSRSRISDCMQGEPEPAADRPAQHEPDRPTPLAQRPRLKGPWATSPEIDAVVAVCEEASNRLHLPLPESYDLGIIAQRVVGRELDVDRARQIAAWAGVTTDRWWLGTKPKHPGDKRKWGTMLGDEKFWSEVLPGAERLARRVAAIAAQGSTTTATADEGPPLTPYDAEEEARHFEAARARQQLEREQAEQEERQRAEQARQDKARRREEANSSEARRKLIERASRGRVAT